MMRWSRSALEGWFRQSFMRFWLRNLAPLLRAAAFLWRSLLLQTTFIAITGSVGKTTAKECLFTILSQRHRTFRSVREQNGGFLVPLNLLRARPWHSFAVLELATTGPGNMTGHTGVVRPNVAVILNVARTHTRNYHSLEETADEKWQILTGVEPGGTVIINADDPLLTSRPVPSGIRVVTFGTNQGCDFQATDPSGAWPDRLSFTVRHGSDSACVRTNLVGLHWIPSILAAVAAAVELGLKLEEAADGLAGYRPFNARMQPVRLPTGAVLIRDEYNGSIDTYISAFQFLEQAHAARRILVAGAHTDTQQRARDRMKWLGTQAARISDLAVFIGESSHHAVKAAAQAGMASERIHGFCSLRAASDFLRDELRDGDLALIKGRTTEHFSRMVLAQFGEVTCWIPSCRQLFTCDFCWKLGLTPGQLRALTDSDTGACAAPVTPQPPGKI